VGAVCGSVSGSDELSVTVPSKYHFSKTL